MTTWKWTSPPLQSSAAFLIRFATPMKPSRDSDAVTERATAVRTQIDGGI